MLFAFGLVFSTSAYGHAFGGRYDLPLPLPLYLGAACLAVLLSFVIAFYYLKEGNNTRIWRKSFSVGPITTVSVRWVLRICGVLILLLILTTAFLGEQSSTKNIAAIMVWVLWWVGFTLISALIVNIWPYLNPFFTIANGVCKIVARKGQSIRPSIPSYAPYMMVLGLCVLSWIELISNIPETPKYLFGLIIFYLVTTCFFALRYGVVAWFSKADLLTHLFNQLGRLAPIDVSSSKITVRFPGAGLTYPQNNEVSIASAIFILVLIGMVLFDGLSETPLWQSLLAYFSQSETWRPLLLTLKSQGYDVLSLLKALGLFFVLLFTVIVYWALCYFVWRASRKSILFSKVVIHFSLSLLPIAIAYHLAHYISYLLLAGQLIIPLLSDPFSLGWDLLGTRLYRIDISVINAEEVWWIAVFSVVIGHVISVFVAHHEAICLFKNRTLAIKSQIPMLIFMTLLTFCSLWILAQPIVV